MSGDVAKRLRPIRPQRCWRSTATCSRGCGSLPPTCPSSAIRRRRWSCVPPHRSRAVSNTPDSLSAYGPELEGTPGPYTINHEPRTPCALVTSGKCATTSSLVSPESARRRKGPAVMNRRFYRIVVSSVSAAVMAGFVGAGVAQASVPAAAPLLTASTSFPQTDPPGPCRRDELGQTKRGRDGKIYKCVPRGSVNSTMPTGTLA